MRISVLCRYVQNKLFPQFLWNDAKIGIENWHCPSSQQISRKIDTRCFSRGIGKILPHGWSGSITDWQLNNVKCTDGHLFEKVGAARKRSEYRKIEEIVRRFPCTWSLNSGYHSSACHPCWALPLELSGHRKLQSYLRIWLACTTQIFCQINCP